MKKWYTMTAKGKSADISIFDEIGVWGITAKDFADDLKALGNVSLIDLHLNSPGGSVIDGIAMYNLLKNHKARVTVYIEGVALSMASVIAMAGDYIYMAENGLMMIHNPWGGALGDADELRKTADVMDKMKDSLILAYVKKTEKSTEDISALMDEETWFSAAEALEAGFVDELIESIDVAAVIKNIPDKYLEIAGSKILISNVDDLKKPDQIVEPLAVANITQEGKTMTEEEKLKAAAEKQAAQTKAAAEKAAIDALAKEDERKAQIVSIFGAHPDHKDLLNECILNSGIDVNVARQKLLDVIGTGAKPAAAGDVTIEMLDDVRDKFMIGAGEAIEIRSGAKPDVPGNEFRGCTLLDLAKQALKVSNVSTKGMDKMRIVAAAFTHSTSDFPLLLENSLGKELRNAYGEFPETWKQWVDTGSVPDFKLNSRIQLGSFNSLDTIPEGGEYKFGTFSEEAERIQAETKGRAISITRQGIINDDLGGFIRLARMMGRAAQRTIGNDVYNMLQANPNMSDGNAVFSAAHSNLPTGAAPDVTVLGAARTLMRKQKDTDQNDFLNIQPVYLLAGVEQEDVLNVLLSSETDPSQSNSRAPNPIRNIATLITDPRLNATEWYFVANQNEAPLMEVAFLDGNQTPYIESKNGFTVDGVMFKVRLDYGISPIDFRGGVMGNA